MKSILYPSTLCRRLMAEGVIAALLLVTPLAVGAQTPRSRPPLRGTGETRPAYEHGYRAGYEDGYEQGRAGFERGLPRDHERSADYRRADRTYEPRMGTFTEYKDGYRAGFELAYSDGYFGRPYSVSVPSNLAQIVGAADRGPADRMPSDRSPVDRGASDRSLPDDRNRDRYEDRRTDRGVGGVATTDGVGGVGGDVERGRDRRDVLVSDGEELRIALTSPISTKTNREGDTFSARVILPREMVDATITGRVASVKRAGRATGKTELLLAFEEIVLPDGRRGPLDAQVVRVFEGETVKTVDEEGNVQTGSRTRDTATRGAGGAAIGAVIGAIAGGGKGAAIGAAIGAAAGAGSVVVQGDKDLILDTGTEMVVRVNGSSRR
jgi:hypothetical protein